MAKSFAGKKAQMNTEVDQALLQIDVPSWEDVRSRLESQMQTDEERLFRSETVALGYHNGSPLNKIRLFDASNKPEDVRVLFYRDSASWCPYCQKVWMTLEEKKIPYRVEKINMRCYGDKPASFNRLQPSGQIPVAEIDGTVYRQSNDILQVLEESFPNYKSLRPPQDKLDEAQSLLRLERQIFGAWMYWLTGPSSQKGNFVATLERVEQALAKNGGPFFFGAQVTQVDFLFAPFLERMAASLLYYKGFSMRNVPGEPSTPFTALNRWYDAMEELPSYSLTQSDYYTHNWDLPPQLGGCQPEPAGAPFRDLIDGAAWKLPLQPHNGGVEPDWDQEAAAAQREAVERVSANHEAITKFAARGAGRPGMPPVSAPLADPNAQSNEAVFAAVSLALRIISLALLEGSTTEQEGRLKEMGSVLKTGGPELETGVLESLAYLRDRVGVPRDMGLPAALQLRAHLNWAMDTIEAASA